MKSKAVCVISLILMVVSHTGWMLFFNMPAVETVLLAVGSIEFPLFCLLFGVMYANCKSRPKIILQLFICAVVWQVVYSWVIWLDGTAPFWSLGLTFTFLGAAVLIHFIEIKNYPLAIMWTAVLLPMSLFYSVIIYQFAGIILILIYYFAAKVKDRGRRLAIYGAGLVLFNIIWVLLCGITYELASLFAFVFILLYRPETADSVPVPFPNSLFTRVCFYAVYPLHFLILGLLRVVIF